MTSDRIFGLVVIAVALAYIAGAFQIQTSFLSDPIGSKTFPLLIGGVAALSALVIVIRPDPDPEWPGMSTFLHLGIALAVLIAYAYALKPLGFLLPTALAAAILSYQITPRPVAAAVTGVGLSVGLFILFRYGLELGLFALPRSLHG
ncbi:tripartite tricarboxylate transporter TctB family protein [Ostreiculturibacter nitratireducens]|uniref:tripartite tricarboxylate transporter TctB family protein n=1 Tax=Ostreiculturibacter nitratireducens TaxID=3075226 RepID=UPI0031B5EDA9